MARFRIQGIRTETVRTISVEDLTFPVTVRTWRRDDGFYEGVATGDGPVSAEGVSPSGRADQEGRAASGHDAPGGMDGVMKDILDQINADPRDVTPRLVYADWLEECGNPACMWWRAARHRQRSSVFDEMNADQRLQAMGMWDGWIEDTAEARKCTTSTS